MLNRKKREEEAELTPEEQLEVDFSACDCFEAAPVVRRATMKDADSDFEGLEIADEEESTYKENDCSITEMLKREKLQYVADDDDDTGDANELYDSDELEKNVAMDVEESIIKGDEGDRLYENSTPSDADRKYLMVDENETVEQVSRSIENLPSTVTLNSRKSISSYTIPEPDESENRFRPEDYIKLLDFEVGADCEDIHFQREQFEFYGIEKNGRKFNLDTATFAKALTKKLTAKVFNSQLFLYNHRRGIFEPVTDADFKRITYKILNEICSGAWKRNKQSEYVEAFKYEVEQYEKFMYNRRYLSFNNCTLDLRTMNAVPHSPFFNSTNHLGYDYDETADCPLWEETLNKIFLGDKAVIESFREMFGCFLIHGKGKGMDKLFILYGSGSNGKSLCTNVIKDVLTEKNCSAKEFASIGQKFSLATIYDKFVNISSENQKVINDTAIYKAVTSSDSVDIERKYQDSYSAVPYVKLVCSTNKLPQFNDDSNGMLRRIHIFNFKARFIDNINGHVLSKNEFFKDPLLFEKLQEERAGILNWALVGTKRLINNQYMFSMPTAVRRYNEDFALNLNPVKIFLDSCITNKQGNRIRTTEVISHYRSWAKLHDVKNQNFHGNQQFHPKFKECLGEADMTNKTVQIKGYDYYCDFEIDASYPLVLPQCF